METRSGSIARGLMDLIEWIDGLIECVGEVLADWSGFPFDVGYVVALMLTPFALLFAGILCWQILEAIAVRVDRHRRRRRGG